MSRDWARWHDDYEDPSSPLSTRLAIVRAHLADAITAAPPGPLSLVSLCAGQGHDVPGVLPGHDRRDDVTADIARTVAATPALCAPGGTVIWTRHRRPPDLTPQVREWFAAAGFTEVAFEAPVTGSTLIGVGVHRRPAGLAGRSPAAGLPGGRLFTFASSS